ncbi:MAG TPA: BatD family protein, partial [Saprospiraceae bacterium]|nr:BatD family protein [Saprospiraceae bacterium]
FSGAVGQYSIRTIQSGSTQITTDDDFSLRIEITGNGDSRRWDPPAIETDGQFEIYDPRIIEDKMMDAEGQVIHSRLIEYVMIPLQSGQDTVQIPFRFFNPVTKLYETITSDAIQLTVSQGKNLPRHISPDSSYIATPRPIKKVNNLHNDDRFWLSIPHLFLFGLLISGTCWGMMVSYKRRKENAIPEVERLRSISSRNARQLLDTLHKSGDQLTEQEFFEKITEVYYKFLSEKFSILPADLDADKIITHFKSTGMPDDVSKKALNFFNSCLSIRYGGVPVGFSRDEMIRECYSIIDELDSAAKPHI